MISRARYLKHLEQEVETSRRIINDLTQENYQLRALVTQAATQPTGQQSHESYTGNLRST